jgi:uncharacterized protein YlxP (DUF503 family)
MIVGVKAWELQLAGCQSLKDKRRVIKSLKDRLHARFNVSVAEVDHQDSWQRAALAASVVSNDQRHAAEVLGACDQMVQREPLAHIVTSETSFL